MYDEKLDYDPIKKYGGELCSVFYQIYYDGFCQYCNLQYCHHSVLPPGPEYQVKFFSKAWSWWILFSMTYCFSKRYSLKKMPQNLMDIKLNYVFALILSQVFVYDQTKNVFIGIFYESLGPEKAFKIWWLGFLMDNFLSQCKF